MFVSVLPSENPAIILIKKLHLSGILFTKIVFLRLILVWSLLYIM
jgi:hypothetical protein